MLNRFGKANDDQPNYCVRPELANLFAKAGAISLKLPSFSPENTMAGMSNGATASIVSINPSWLSVNIHYTSKHD